MKICSVCKIEKPLDNFYLHKGNRTSLGYRNPMCKTCHSEKSLLWAKNNPEKIKLNRRKTKLKQKYNITTEEYNIILLSQEGKCKLCEDFPSKRSLAVDHCHTTGKVRGLLCDKCNMALGLLKDNLTVIKKLEGYLL